MWDVTSTALFVVWWYPLKRLPFSPSPFNDPQACSGAGEWRAALSLLDDVQAEGLRPGGAAYVAAMAACARGGVVERALELLDRVLVEHPGDETARHCCLFFCRR